ncbi:retrotransposon protein, putative, ty1-copia subclass, partial [Tanacetum coccineum]
GEYTSQEFLDLLKECGIITLRTPPYMPQHNGVLERRNRTLLDMGCEALVKRDTLTKPDKLEPRSIKCIFIGYPKETIGYSFYYPPQNKVLVTQDAKFLENSLITQEASGSLEDLKIIQEEDTHPSIDTSLNHEEDDLEIDEPQSNIIPICRSTRTRHVPDRMCSYINNEEHELGDHGEPTNYKVAFWKNDRYCNGGNLPGAYIVGDSLHYQDYEWYEALKDSELKEQALRNKAIMEGLISDDESSDDGIEYEKIGKK